MKKKLPRKRYSREQNKLRQLIIKEGWVENLYKTPSKHTNKPKGE